MKIVYQRVRRGAVTVAGEKLAAIGHGVVLLVGVAEGDGLEQVNWLAKKCAELRVFDDEDGKMNLSLLDVGGEALVVSQFTLLANTKKGRRPSFVHAAPPEIAEPLVESFARRLKELGVPVQMGHFGAHMLVDIENDGPVTILLEHSDESP